MTRDAATVMLREVWQRHRPAQYTWAEAVERLEDVYERYPAGGPGTQPIVAAGNVEHRAIRLTPASSILMTRPSWAWHERFPIGGATLVPGIEGEGKTLLVGDIAAKLTRGTLDGEFKGTPVDVVYIGTEDDRSSVLVPRLVAAGADRDRFHFVDMEEGASFSLTVDCVTLADSIRLSGRTVGMVVVDPLDAYLGVPDSHRKAEVQAAIGKVAYLAQAIRCAGVSASLTSGRAMPRRCSVRLSARSR